MASFDYDVGILGGGAAGLTMASGAAQLGAKTILIEREPMLGGDCLHYGCVPSKTLIKSAMVYHQLRHAQRYGLPRVQAPPVDFAQIAGRIRSVIAAIGQHDVERFCGLGVRVEFGQARFVDEHCVDLKGRRIAARSWLIATGSRPAAPPVPDLEATPYLTNKEIFSLERLPDSLLILGAGPIAIEMAQAFGRLGSRVTVVQRSGQILSNDDADLAGLLLEVLRQEGVEVHLNAKVLSARDLGSSRELTIADAQGQERRLSASVLLVALGRAPNLEDLGLEAAGVERDAKGLKLDCRLRSSQRHIYGAGDVTGGFQFTHAAGYEAGVALTNAVLRLSRKADYTFMPWCAYTDPELASIGLNEKQAREAQIEYQVWSEEFRANDRALAEGREAGRIKMLVDRQERPLGMQILGPAAGELLGEWVAALGGGLKLSTLAGAVHPYPTLGEINKRLAVSLLTPKLFSERVRKSRACQGPPAV